MNRIIVKGNSVQEMINEMKDEEVRNIDFYRKSIKFSGELKKRKLEMVIKSYKKNNL